MPNRIAPTFAGSMNDAELEKQSYWRLCYPRIYESVSSFASPKRVAYDLATIFWDHTAFMRQKPGAPAAQQLDPAIIGSASYHATRLTRLRVPMFFVERDLLAALTKTTPPEVIDWKAMQLPFDAAAFIFPTNALSVPGVGDIEFVWYSRALKEQPLTIPSDVPHDISLPTSQFYIRTVPANGTDEAPAIIFQINNDTDPTIDLSKSLDDVGVLDASSPFSDSERKVAAIISGLVFNLILAVDARPELLTHGSTKGKRSKKGSEFWHPNIIGKAYRIAGAGGGEGGSGITQRMHWRRGHWRSQAHGSGYTQRKNIWIEPTLVAAQ